MSWSEDSRRIVGEVIAGYKGSDEKELRKLISAAYPFGERAMWPYKCWCKTVAIQVRHWKAWLNPEPQKESEPVTDGLFEVTP